jgi:hypothetical protein
MLKDEKIFYGRPEQESCCVLRKHLNPMKPVFMIG